MDLNTSLGIASSGLSAVSYELGVASQNVANASTPGYATEIANVASRESGGIGNGVAIQLTTREVNTALQNGLYAQNAIVAGLGVTTNALSAVSNVQGTTSADAGSTNTLADNVGNLQNAFTTLESDPSNSVAQQQVVSSASTLAQSVQTLSETYQAQRQDAQQAIGSEIDQINQNLSQIGNLSGSIMKAQASGLSTADLENQRAQVMSSLSSQLSVNFTETSNGNMLVTTANGLSLPTNAASGPLSTAAAVIGVGDGYPGSVGGIMLGGQDVSASLTGGSLGANITLRDDTLPTMQAELDSFSATLANRFSAQGLTLFTDASGALPGSDPTSVSPAGTVGFSAAIQVNPSVLSTPSLVRDGTQAIQDPTAGAPGVSGAVLTGASAFTPNPAGGPVGFTTLISRVLSYTFGTSVQPGTTQPAAPTSGLGLSGTLSAPYSGSGSLSTLATTLTSSQAQTISAATSDENTQTAIQTRLQANLSASTGVSVDDQMANVVALQNAYEANAKVVAAVQTMFTALLAALS